MLMQRASMQAVVTSVAQVGLGLIVHSKVCRAPWTLVTQWWTLKWLHEDHIAKEPPPSLSTHCHADVAYVTLRLGGALKTFAGDTPEGAREGAMPSKEVQWVHATHRRLNQSRNTSQEVGRVRCVAAEMEAQNCARAASSCFQDTLNAPDGCSHADPGPEAGGASRPPGMSCPQPDGLLDQAKTWIQVREDLSVAPATFEPQRYSLIVEGRPVQVALLCRMIFSA